MTETTWRELVATGAIDGLELAAEVAAARRLHGHASRRRFFRLRLENGGVSTAILVVYPEKGADGPSRYRVTASWLRDAAVRVPAILGEGRRSLLVEDGGDRLLADVDGSESELGRLYRQATEVICRIQRHGRKRPAPDGGPGLDRSRLLRELEFFETEAVDGWLGLVGGEEARRGLYRRLAGAVAALPTAVCHRDYHSRNLLAAGDRLMVLDFQDLMPGPILYDIVSLLRDDYRDLPERLQPGLLSRFWLACGRELTESPVSAIPARPAGLPGVARQAFCLVALQRSLKALGTFGHQIAARGNRTYAEHAPRTWRHARNSLEALGWDPGEVGLEGLHERLG